MLLTKCLIKTLNLDYKQASLDFKTIVLLKTKACIQTSKLGHRYDTLIYWRKKKQQKQVNSRLIEEIYRIRIKTIILLIFYSIHVDDVHLHCDGFTKWARTLPSTPSSSLASAVTDLKGSAVPGPGHSIALNKTQVNSS